MAGYKLKSKGSAKKRFKFTASGKIKCKRSKMRHILSKKSPAMKRRLRAAGQIADVDVASVKRMLPYS